MTNKIERCLEKNIVQLLRNNKRLDYHEKNIKSFDSKQR